MQIGFDQIYCVSYCRNIAKQQNIRRVMGYLGLKFDFIYGADYTNLHVLKDVDFKGGPGNDKEFLKDNWRYFTHFIGASYDHYTAVIRAYESGANSVLIMEDDCVFINDIQYINYHLSNYPRGKDIIKFGVHNLTAIQDMPKNTYVKLDLEHYPGAQLYGLCNRDVMRRYIEWQSSNFVCCDYLFPSITDNWYGLVPPLAVDEFMLKEVDKPKGIIEANKYCL